MNAIERLTSTVISNNEQDLSVLLRDKQYGDLLNSIHTYSMLLSFAQRYNYDHSASVLMDFRKQPYFFPKSVQNAIADKNTVMLKFYRENQSERLDDFIKAQIYDFCCAIAEAYGSHIANTGDRMTA